MIAHFDVVVFVSEVSHAVVVDAVDYGGACKRNIILIFTKIIAAQVAYDIDQRGCLGGSFDILALRMPAIIEGNRVSI